MTVSHWRRSKALGQIHTDTLVVGGGICGISAGLALQRRGERFLIVERHAVGSGASTRNAGFLMRGAAGNYAAVAERFGRDMARTIWRWSEENLAGLREEGIESLATCQRIGSCLLALEPSEHDQLVQAAQMLGEDGFAVEWVGSGTDSAWQHARPLGGLLNPHDAACNSYDLLRFLASKVRQGILEHQEVAEISPAGAGLRVRISDGEIITSRVLLCTNAYLPLLLPQFEHLITPRRGQMIALGNPGLRLDCSYYANFGYEYFRQATDGTVVIGGCRRRHAEREVGYEDRLTPLVQDDIEAFAERALGIPRRELQITARWSGTMGFSPDGLPLVGPLPGPWPADSVWFCGGFTGHGMSMGYRTAQGAVAAMLGGDPTPFSLARLRQSGSGV